MPDQSCLPKAGGTLTTVPWAQQRLDFRNVWAITQGAGVRVAVIDSGMDRTQPQMARIKVSDPGDVLPGFAAADIRDCVGHGTGVTGIIAAPQLSNVPFYGVAPKVTIIPIKQTDSVGSTLASDVGIAQGIDYARVHHAQVVNISVTVTVPSLPIEAAVARAQRAGMVIVAAAGNDGAGVNAAAYPAAFAPKYDNVIAVSAADAQDQVPQFSERGTYVTVCAPGVGVIFPARQSGYTKDDGTSFAAPFVTGTVALMIAAAARAHTTLTPLQIRNRIIATADPPPVSTPDPRYGYGMVNPYRAVTAVRDDVATTSPSSAAPLPAPVAAPPADRSLQHQALGAAASLLVLSGLVLVVWSLARRRRTALHAGGSNSELMLG